MNRLFVGMDVYKEKIVVVGLPPSNPLPSTFDVRAVLGCLPFRGGYTDGGREPEEAAGDAAGSVVSDRSIRPPKHNGRPEGSAL